MQAKWSNYGCVALFGEGEENRHLLVFIKTEVIAAGL